MLVFVFLIGLSACFYVYYKVKGIQTKRALEKECFSAKSSMALGALVLLYGVNQMILFHSVLTLVIGGVFILIGAGSAWAGIEPISIMSPSMQRKRRGTTHN